MTATTPSTRPVPAVRPAQAIGRVATRIAIWVILCGGAIAMILPFLWMISSSLKTRSQVWVFPPDWIPDPVQWHNYVELSSLPFL